MKRTVALFAAGAALLSLVSCTGGEDVGFGSEPLRAVATEYPEAVLVDAVDSDGNGAGCSGALVAPRVVLTAGHCVAGFVSWTVTAPNASGASLTAYATSGDPGDYFEVTKGDVNPMRHDVGLVFLDEPIEIATYPLVAQYEARDGQEAITIGRRAEVGGTVSNDELYAGEPFDIHAADDSAPYDYDSLIEIDHGDSGGPLLAYPSDPHLILAVNSGGLPMDSEYARTDLVYGWIQSAILIHGGGGRGADAGNIVTP